MPRTSELDVSQWLGKELGISFRRRRLPLGSWGQADDWSRLEDNTLVSLEVEEGQKHPSTNVVKYWPFLDERPDERVLLIQVFFTYSPGLASNRGNICRWYGDRIAAQVPGRFERFQVVFQKDGTVDGLDTLRERLAR